MKTSPLILEKFERWLACIGRNSGVGAALVPTRQVRGLKVLRDA